MNSRFRLYGKEFMKWAKIEKAKNAARASAREKMVSSPQRLLGHSDIKTTMDRYVHVTDASLSNAVKQFEQCTTIAS